MMQSSYDDTVENGAREEKKDIPTKKRVKKKISSTFGPLFPLFEGKKGKTHPNLDRSRRFIIFFVVKSFVAGKREEKIKGRMERQTRERPKENSFFPHDNVVVTIAGLL